MFKLIKKIDKDLIFIFYSISFISIVFIGYNYKINKDKEIIEPGFQSASSIKNNIDNCNGDLLKIENSKCIFSLSQELKKSKNNALFLGNSQTGAINNYKKNDDNYISIINKNKLVNKKFTKINSIWLPNATLNEFSEIINQFNNCNFKINILIIPIFLDDTRIDSKREGVKIYDSIICKYKSLEKASIDKEKGNLYYLNNKIEKNLLVFGYLDKLNQDLKINLYKLRNLIFNISPGSARKIKESSYNSNLKSLTELLEKRGLKKLKTVLYIPPILNAKSQGEIPYLRSEYNKFKSDIETLCKGEFCIYLNLENLIPNEFWGKKNSTSLLRKNELDFMHFTGLGHKILANYFIEFLINPKFFD